MTREHKWVAWLDGLSFHVIVHSSTCAYLAVYIQGHFGRGLQKREKNRCGSWRVRSVCEWKLKGKLAACQSYSGIAVKDGLGKSFPLGTVQVSKPDPPICVEKEILWAQNIWRLVDSSQWLVLLVKGLEREKLGGWGQSFGEDAYWWDCGSGHGAWEHLP